MSELFKKLNLYRLNRLIINKIHSKWMLLSFIFIITIPFIMLIGLYFKSSYLFEKIPIIDLLFTSEWLPSQEKFGFLPFIISSLWVTVLALLFSAPICLLSAILLTQYGKKRMLSLMHPVIDILAGIPSVVYGVWGLLLIVPMVSDYIAPIFNIKTSGYCILSGAIVLSVMIIPFILNILIEIFKAVPIDLTEISLSLGASRWETIKFVVIKKAYPGIISAFGLGISRAFGETIAVLMVVGNVIKIPTSVFDAGYPLPALIANNYGEMMSIPLYDSALMFAAFILFAVVLLFNFASRMAIIKYERMYK
ncbi:MAG: phosphate ABC transporter permease subunit PstC [Bacteroidetes bacterium GWA2_31_9]|nr:MAG: phosphate ABC transporter permease subunit PstC [Bacteroidetes bacterium GWA2_31_9]